MRRYAVFVLAGLSAILLSSELALSLPLGKMGPDLLMVVVCAFVSGDHPRTAALAGYGAGLFRDLLLTTPTGLGALAYAVTAYGVALAGPIRGVWAFVGLVGGATFVSQTLWGLGTILVGPTGDAGVVPRVIGVTTLYNTTLSPLLLPLLRRVLISPAAAPSAVE